MFHNYILGHSSPMFCFSATISKNKNFTDNNLRLSKWSVVKQI